MAGRDFYFRLKSGGSPKELFTKTRQRMAEGLTVGGLRIAKSLQDEVVARVPQRTGALRNAFASPDAIASIDGKHFRFGLLTPELRNAAYYALWVEYGTKRHPSAAAQATVTFTRKGRTVTRKNARSRRYRGHAATPAQPFLRPAAHVVRLKVQEIMWVAMTVMGMPGLAGKAIGLKMTEGLNDKSLRRSLGGL